ncbi:hypothetical protein COCSUDRAFT_62392 [Coccomyxa subellipsoidea C-169]|uniref:Uncharacterized protein n=1 Tax=Coccomyxa subellipsoidea (strain C-169) TaxID=574566 RepID=I0YZP3_COCSC|nr:hypothetical protein COCSUDRAFT_62392 [Coccomyxa subellipsoidea C-169]EIE23862.1 hypothetical protein COCSUDRAFT_62392 [Coccomyxa subellipsoidea C-169]|eukprot:XP_005648406.1 hypothetical protein COCSUDRAFT_62392 [Coccomyxa subellipsoidea C-169]
MAAREVAALTFLAAVCLLCAAPAAAWSSSTTAHRHSLAFTAPEAASHAPGMHIVISMYQEDIMQVQQYLQRLLSIHSVAATRPRIFLYVKGGPEFFARARELSFAHEIHEVPNIGREQETYLRHVVAHYERLPQHALPNYEENMLSRLQTLFGPRTGAMGLGLTAVCTCEGHSQLWPEWGAGGFIRLREVWALAQGTLCPHEFACFHNGFLVASRARLHLQTKKLYEYLLGLFTTSADHPLRVNEFLYKHHTSNIPEEWPTFGHVMERSWNALLNCTDVNIAYSCSAVCEQEDCTGLEHCQCLDEGSPHDGVAPI